MTLSDKHTKEFSEWLEPKLQSDEAKSILKREGVYGSFSSHAVLSDGDDLIKAFINISALDAKLGATYSIWLEMSEPGCWYMHNNSDLEDLAVWLADQATNYGLLGVQPYDPFNL